MPAAERLQRWLLSHWFAPRTTWAARLAAPLSRLYGWLSRRDRQRRQVQAATLPPLGVPVVVVGNLVVGGAGKTPATIAIVDALIQAGRRPAVVSRGHGRSGRGIAKVTEAAGADEVGDEPMLIARRTGVPVWVGADRAAAARRLLQRHPEVDVVVCDDALQHRQLARDVEVVVFDARGIGNGRLLPGGPLREPFKAAPPRQALVLYTDGSRSTGWTGHAARRQLAGVCPWREWWLGHGPMRPLETLSGRRLLAMAGTADPERFFSMLEACGLTIDRLPLPDHHRYEVAPWPARSTEIITTEKDAVKLQRWAADDPTGPAIWVVGLDLTLPAEFVAELLARTVPAHRP